MTVSGDAAPVFVPVTPPFDDVHVAVKLVMAAPLFAPAVNETRICPAAVFSSAMPVGAAGDPTITDNEGAEASPAPRAFVAFTLQV